MRGHVGETIISKGDGGDGREGVESGRMGAVAPIRTRLAHAGEGTVHNRRVDCLHDFVVQAETLYGLCAQAIHENFC